MTTLFSFLFCFRGTLLSLSGMLFELLLFVQVRLRRNLERRGFYLFDSQSVCPNCKEIVYTFVHLFKHFSHKHFFRCVSMYVCLCVIRALQCLNTIFVCSIYYTRVTDYLTGCLTGSLICTQAITHAHTHTVTLTYSHSESLLKIANNSRETAGIFRHGKPRKHACPPNKTK